LLLTAPLAGVIADAATSEEFILSATSATEFRKQAGGLRGQMGPGGTYGKISRDLQERQRGGKSGI